MSFASSFLGNPDQNRDIELADATGDGLPDAITATDSGKTRFYVNNGSADPFGGVTATLITPPLISNSLAHGDLNGDGTRDLVIGGQGDSGIALDSGAQDPFAGVIPQQLLTTLTQGVALGDLDGDGIAAADVNRRHCRRHLARYP